MGKPSDELNPDENDDEITEESSDEDEKGPNENNESTPPADLSSLNRETTYNVQQGNQDWQRFILFLTGNGTRIVQSCNRNRHARNGHFLLTDIFMIMFMLFATIIFITRIPLDIENRQTHVIGMHDDVNNTYQNVPVNNENARNDNFDDDRINLFPYDETGSQVVIRESNASEAVDHRTYDSSSFISAKIPNDTNSNLKIVEEKGITFSSAVEPYVDDTIEIDSDSDDTHSITSVRGPISDDDDESVVSEISLDLNDLEDDQIDDTDEESVTSEINLNLNDLEDDQIDDTDEESVTSPGEDDSNDSISDDTDDGYGTSSESSLSSEINNGANDEHSLIDDNNESLLSDHGYQTNGEDSLINNDVERSLVSNISYENDPIDDDDRWSDISHITYYISSDNDSINDNDAMSTDDGYGTKSETDSLVDDEKDVVLIEIQSNELVDKEVSTIELSIPPTLLTDSTTEKNADLLSNFERPLIMSSMDPSNVEQSSSFDLNREKPSSQVFENHTQLEGNVDPLVLVDIQPPKDSNADHHQGNSQAIGFENPLHSDDRNNHGIASENQRDHVLSISELLFNNVQNNEQAASQTLVSGQSPGQALQIEKASTDDSESDDEEMARSTRSMNMKLQKRRSPAVDSHEESSKKNVD